MHIDEDRVSQQDLRIYLHVMSQGEVTLQVSCISTKLN
jgi:hypothetical protein